MSNMSINGVFTYSSQILGQSISKAHLVFDFRAKRILMRIDTLLTEHQLFSLIGIMEDLLSELMVFVDCLLLESLFLVSFLV